MICFKLGSVSAEERGAKKLFSRSRSDGRYRSTLDEKPWNAPSESKSARRTTRIIYSFIRILRCSPRYGDVGRDLHPGRDNRTWFQYRSCPRIRFPLVVFLSEQKSHRASPSFAPNRATWRFLHRWVCARE